MLFASITSIVAYIIKNVNTFYVFLVDWQILGFLTEVVRGGVGRIKIEEKVW